MTEGVVHRKTLRRRDIVLFTVAAILLPDTLASAASIGAAAISWWVLLSLFFLMPFALISAELGCAYPEQGGVYAWVRDAFGARWGSRVTWCYWINTAVWLPSVATLFAGILKQLFFPELSFAGEISVAILLCAFVSVVGCLALDLGKWVPNIGAIAKFFFFGALILGAAIFVWRNGMATPLTLADLTPRLGDSLQFIPAIIYGMLGFELICASSEEMRDPARDVPRATMLSAVIVSVLYTLGTVAILAALPVGEVDLVYGLIDALRSFYAGALQGPIIAVLGVAVLFAIFSSGATWAIGVNRAAAEAGIEGELPRVFSIETHNGAPLGATVLMGLTSSSMLLIYGFSAGSNSDLFWALFSFSGVIFFLPYIAMAAAFLRLRSRDPQHPRPFRLPGPPLVACIAGSTCIVALSVSACLFMVTPGDGPQWPVIMGVVSMLGLGELITRLAERRAAKTAALDLAAET